MLVIALALIGGYIRLLPALNYGLEMDANDPWIAYWLAEYFHENGLFAFDGLRHVDSFWWPNGRDFLKGEKIGVSWLAAATYPIGESLGLTLKEWLALFPVFAGVLAILLSYMLVVELTGSRLGGVVTASIFALYPGAIVRTTVNFVEKTGIAIPLLTLFYILIAKSLKESDERKALIKGLLAGVTGGLIGFFWGGYDVAIVSLAALILLDPLISKPSESRLRVYASAIAGTLLATAPNPVVGISYYYKDIGVSLIAAIAIYAIILEAAKRPLPLYGSYTKLKYAWTLSVFIVLGIITLSSGLIRVSGRILMALGIRQLSPLAESVQEHQPVTWSTIFDNYGIPLIITLAGAIYYIATRIATPRAINPRRDLLIILMYIMSLLLVYNNKQLAYFTQMASYFVSVSAGVSVGLIASGIIERRGKVIERNAIKILAAGFITLTVLISTGYYGYSAYTTNQYRAPQILTSGLGPFLFPSREGTTIKVPLNKAWINALEYIKNSTREDALIVSWWDYGYWITVYTGRKTMADGATANETHIRLLAQILTGTEGDANYLLRKIGAEPNNTYVVFYEVFRGQLDKNQSTMIIFPEPGIQRPDPARGLFYGIVTHGSADFAKSFQMLKISYKIDPFAPSALFTAYSTEVVDDANMRWIHFPGFVGVPEENRTRVLNTLLYKLGLYGLTYLSDPNITILDEGCGFMEKAGLVMPAVIAYSTIDGNLRPQIVLPAEPKSFEPAAISVGCPIVREDSRTISFVSVIVYIYKWIG
ncbi:MAG: hypothetical protein GSR85_09455 [Desulfurococcales archaeon]|nr:hypothetical protein [Desulfurococcales archaeon]